MMRPLTLVCVPILLLAATDPAWQTKPIAEWTQEDSVQVLNDSPWAKKVTPKVLKAPDSVRGGNIAQLGGMGIGMPGMGGMGGGMGRHGGARPQTSDTSSSTAASSSTPPSLTIRWESALPLQAAELKSRNVNAPSMDEDHYAVAVYGVPSHAVNMDSAGLNEQLKGQASLKRTGKKDINPSSVEVIPRDDGTLIVYFFSRSKEITKQDKEVDFSAQIGRFLLSVPFETSQMTYQGKLEL
jgi:hypothetical protein